jgi:DNA (cytosine-5)-methyltransferase 1
MDVDEENINKLLTSGISDSQLYKMAGNSIVVACMEGIFYNLFSNEEQETLTLF